ncbi:MAG: amidohydrolase family protein [Bacillota bacterium]
MLLIKNGWVITCDGKKNEIKKGNLVIQDGIITDINTKEDMGQERFDKVIDAEGKFVMPGLINAHTHSYANMVKATTENIPLEIWMLYIMAQGRCMDREDVYYNALLGSIEMIKTGTTSCVDHLAQSLDGLEAALQAYDDIGFRAAVAPMISDKSYFETLPLNYAETPEEFKQANPSVESLIDTNITLLKKWHGKANRLSIMLGPSGPQRCSDELLRRCSQLAEEYDTGVHSHVLETKIQADTAVHLYGKPMVKHLDEIGCLNERFSMVHSVWLTDQEIKLAAQRGAIVVHNPASNLILGSGIAPINKYREAGITVALGTDGANCGGNLNMFEAIKLAAMLHKFSETNPNNWVTAEEAFKMSTLNGSKVSLQDQKIGSLQIGKRADVVILNPEKSTPLLPLQEPMWQIVYGESGAAVETVLIEGKVVLEDGKILTVDEKKVYQEVNKRAEKITRSFLKFKDSVEKQGSYLQKHLFSAKAKG